jgi:hypothetical protein
MRHPETGLQLAAVEYLGYAKPAAIWLHIPNGGKRSKTEAAILKGMGVKVGAPGKNARHPRSPDSSKPGPDTVRRYANSPAVPLVVGSEPQQKGKS